MSPQVTIAGALHASHPKTDLLDRRLETILRSLDEKELYALAERTRIALDPAKRIDIAAQIARALVQQHLPQQLDHLPSVARTLFLQIAKSKGVFRTSERVLGLDHLYNCGLVFARKVEGALELIIPNAFLLQMDSWEEESPRAIRGLLMRTSSETLNMIASHYLGRPATPPVVFGLEVAWGTFSNERLLRHEIETLAPAEHRLLQTICELGGEVETQELLDLEKEPVRLRIAAGVSASRRGPGFALERRGFLIPLHPSRHIVPDEVMDIVVDGHRQARRSQRAKIRSFVLDSDHLPHRARFSVSAGMLAVAMAMAVREAAVECRSNVGTSKALITRMAQRFGRTHEAVALIAALSRAIGLWEPSAIVSTLEPGSFSIQDLETRLFEAWRWGSVWDESRAEPELIRLASTSRDMSPVGILKEALLAAFSEIGEGHWVPWRSLRDYVLADERLNGISRLNRRWSNRNNVPLPVVPEVLRTIALRSLPALGAVDVGGGDSESELALRLSARGKDLLTRQRAVGGGDIGSFNKHVVTIETSARVATVVGLAQYVEIGAVLDRLELIVTPACLAECVANGVDLSTVTSRLRTVAELSPEVEQLIDAAKVVVGRVNYVPVSGFLWIDDPTLRELLLTRRQTTDMFLQSSPSVGLLIAPNVDMDRMIRRCRSLGIEIESEGQVLRIKSLTGR